MEKCGKHIELTRDIYGFTVRPHHLQRYKEYAVIYEKEEAERSARWEQFLKTYCESTVESLDANESPRKEYYHAREKGESKKFETWNEIRPSLYPVARALQHRFKKKKKDVQANNGSVAGQGEIYQSSSQRESEDESDDEFYDVERSDMAQETHSSAGYFTEESNEVSDHEEDPCPWKEELDALVRGGVPMAMRGEVWQVFMGSSTRRVHGHYQALLTLLADGGGDSNGSGGLCNKTSSDFKVSDTGIIEKWTNQIEKDLPRTFPGHPALGEDGRNSLRRLLTAYARHNPNVGYCQAMNFFAGLLLLMMPEDNAFWTLTGVLDDCFEGYYSEKMLESQVDQLILEELVQKHFPRLMNHLDTLGVQVAWITGPWFLSIFVNILPWESVLRVWDVLLYEGNRCMLFRTTLALMELYGSAIITTKDAGDAVTMLQSFASSTFDSSQLVLTACVGYQFINESQLQELRMKYRPIVLAKFSGRVIDESIWHEAYGPISFSSKLCNYDKTKNAIHNQESANKPMSIGDSAHEFYKDSDDYASLKYRNGEILLDDDILNGAIDTKTLLSDLVNQVKFLKLELSIALEEGRAANLRAEELETAFMELVKEDNRRLLSAKVETLQSEVAYLKQALKDKVEQEQAMVQVMVRMEHEQKLTEDVRRFAEEDAKTQRKLLNELETKYEAATASLKELEKRAAMAESMLNATLQYEALSGGPSKRSTQGDEPSRWLWSRNTSKSSDSGSPAAEKVNDIGSDSQHGDMSPNQGSLTRRFSLSWRDMMKGKPSSDNQPEVSDQQSAEADVLPLHGKEESDEAAKKTAVDQKDPL